MAPGEGAARKPLRRATAARALGAPNGAHRSLLVNPPWPGWTVRGQTDHSTRGGRVKPCISGQSRTSHGRATLCKDAHARAIAYAMPISCAPLSGPRSGRPGGRAVRDSRASQRRTGARIAQYVTIQYTKTVEKSVMISHTYGYARVSAADSVRQCGRLCVCVGACRRVSPCADGSGSARRVRWGVGWLPRGRSPRDRVRLSRARGPRRGGPDRAVALADALGYPRGGARRAVARASGEARPRASGWLAPRGGGFRCPR